MTIVWAIARHMIAEGMRMKIALGFVLLIGLLVLGLPFSIEGDASVTGAVQSFLSYSLGAAGVLLGILTIFMSRSISDELVHRQIFLLVSKPVPRWQYVLGKWLGITVLNGAFLVGAGAAIYAMVHYVKRTHPPIDDRYDLASLTNEVLVARHAIKCTPPDFGRPAESEFQRNLEEGLYDNRPNFDPQAEKAQLAAKYEAQWRVVGPDEKRVFEFHSIRCNRSPDTEVQIRYRTEVSRYPPDEIFRAAWRFGDASYGTPVYDAFTRHVVGRYHTIRVPADAVAPDGTLTATFFNSNPFPSEPSYGSIIEFRRADEVEVLFVVGSFLGNFVRLLVLMMCKLMFLAAVAVLAATMFSFPVACLASFTVYVLAGTRAFIVEALDLASDDYATMFSSVREFALRVVWQVYEVLHWVIPDFARYNAIEDLVNGRNVSLVWVLDALLWLVLVKTLIVLGVAMLLFHRREVAEVSA